MAAIGLWLISVCGFLLIWFDSLVLACWYVLGGALGLGFRFLDF